MKKWKRSKKGEKDKKDKKDKKDDGLKGFTFMLKCQRMVLLAM